MSDRSHAARAAGPRLVLLAALAAASAFPAHAQYFNCGATCHVISGNVSDASTGPFLAGHVYLANGALNVLAGTTLTIQPGAIVKFDGIHAFNVYGTLLANGTAGSPIVVTSLHDDTGGDHNGNGAATGVAPGQWHRMWFGGSSSGSSVNFVTVRGAGWNNAAAIRCESVSPTFTGCAVTTSQGPCVDFGNSASPAFVNCAFVGGTKAAVGVPLSALPGFSGCTATGQTQRDAPEISNGTVSGATAISVDDTFNGSGAVAVPLTVTVTAGGALTLGAGVTLKFDGVHTFNCYGALVANGTTGAPVVLTSMTDDAFGGDTNRDAAASGLSAGQWIQLYLGPDSDASQLHSLRVRGAGWNSNAAVDLDASDATLNDVRVATTGGPCLDLSNNSYPTATNCAFDGGTKAVVGARLRAFAGFTGCTAAGNSQLNAPEVTSGTVDPSETATIAAANTPNANGVVAVSTTLTVAAGGALALGAGVKFKFTGVHTFNVYGTLTTTGASGDPVVFTSIHDDAYGGDSNLNGAASGAAVGHWIQTWFGSTSSASSLQHLLVRCAGWNGNPAFELNQSNLTGVGLRTQLAGGPCLSLSNNSTPTLSGCAFDGGTTAAVSVPPAAVAGFSGCTASGNTQYDAPTLGATTIAAGAAPVFSQGNSFNNDGVFVVPSTLSVAAGAALTLNAGVKLKFTSVHAFNCYGTLTTNGTAAAPAVLTSIHDDAFGGDTNKNGGASAAAAGHWIQAWFGPASDASVLTGLRVRCAGWNGNSSIELSQSSLTMTDARTALCGGPALDLSNDSTPTASFCAFDGGSYAANRVPFAAFAGFKQCTAAGNYLANAPRVTSGTVATGQTALVRAINTFNGNGVVHMATTLTVNGTLDVGPGVAFKFEGVHACNVYGTALFRGSGIDPITFTSIHDDAVGGDTNVNGAASVASNGQWTQLWISAAATGVLDRVRVRFAGWNGSPAVECNAPGVALNAVRVDRSGGPGFRVVDCAGPNLDHCVAWNCFGEGLRVLPAKTVRHATVSGCGGAGVVTQSALATALNCVSWGNGGAGFSGFAAGAVSYSCAAGLASGVFNVTTDPLFVDAVNGDLNLQAASPCVDVAEPGTSFGMVLDHVEGSRLSDGRLIGLPLPDMGAYELAAYRLSATGRPWSFDTLTLQVDGSEPGVAALAFGLGGLPEAIYPWGFLSAGAIPSLTVLAIVPTGVPFVFPMPDVSAYAGGAFVIQALGVPLSNPALGAFTNLYRGVLDG
jgi:hypothetical protein